MMDAAIDTPMIETYVQRIAHVAAGVAGGPTAEAVLSGLGGRVHRQSETAWSVAFGQGAFSGATVELERYGQTSTLRVTFTPRTAGAPLSTLTREPARWTSSVPLPDSGRVSLLRQWPTLPDGLSIGCSSVVEPGGAPGDARVNEITCFVGKL